MACKFCGKPWKISEKFYITTEDEMICYDCIQKNKFSECFVTKKFITEPGFKCDISKKCDDCKFYSKVKKKSIISKYITIACVVLMVIGLCFSSCENSNEFEDVFRKDPNTWTEREKEHVNDFFDYLEEKN